jgi:hypothetical protein
VQVDEGRLAAGQRPAGRHADHRPLVQAEDEVDVRRQPGEERDFGGAGVTEDRRQAEAAHDVEHGLTHGSRRGHGLIAIVSRWHHRALRVVDHR